MPGDKPKAKPSARGLYFEDFEVGKTYRTPRRTVTQTDIVNFACLSGDFNAPHVDWEFLQGATLRRADRTPDAGPGDRRRSIKRLRPKSNTAWGHPTYRP